MRVRQALTAFALLAGAALVFAAPGCGETVPLRDCFARIWVPRADKDVRVIGSFTNWTDPITPDAYDDQWNLVRVELPPGDHGYLLEQNGETGLDPRNPLTTFRENGEEVSLVLIPDCEKPSVLVDTATSEGGRVSIGATFLARKSRAAFDPKTVHVETLDGQTLHVDRADPQTGRIEASAALGDDKHIVVIRARDDDGVDAEIGRASVWSGRRMPTWRDGVLYQIMIDRFRGDAGSALKAPTTPSSFAGGTLDGVRAELESGYFDSLGVTALWLSPVYDNPEEPRLGLDGHPQQAYHGYWPQQSRAVEPRFGGEDALHAVVTAAHARGIAVMLDIVPNHVYESNPIYSERKSDAGFNLPACVCGSPGCAWGQSCWFADYLPDVRFEDGASMNRTVDEAVFWVNGFDLDGVRIDAVPLMPRATTRRIALGLRDETFPRDSTFILGEVFTGPGVASLAELRAHIGPAGLDSVFDFPAMWAVRGAVTGQGGFDQLEAVLAAEDQSFAGSGVLLGRMVDNHDVTRLLSEANGDASGDPWTSPPVQPTATTPYDMLELGLASSFALPGLPILWQGDEIGLAGGSDPDSRRVMPSDAALAPRQLALRAAVGRLAHLRACSASLREGSRTTLSFDARRFAFVRGAETNAPVLVLMSAQTTASPLALATGSLAGKRLVDAFSGETFDVPETGSIEIAMPALSYRFLLTDADPCLALTKP